MDLATMRGVVRSALSTPYAIDEFYLHGGEPLLAGRRFFLALIDEIRSYPAGQQIRIGVQTNGTLIDRNWAQLFAAHDIRVGLSLDGDVIVNDQNRRFTNGSGSYMHVRRALDFLFEQRIAFGVISIVTEASARRCQHATQLVEHLRQLGVLNLDVHPALTPPSTSGSASLFNVSARTFSQFMSSLFDTWLALGDERFVIRSIEDIFQTLSGLTSNVCYRAGTCTSIVGVDPDGSTSPCTRPFKGGYHFGSLTQLSPEAIASTLTFSLFQQQEADGRRRTEHCQWRHLCGYGSCPHERFLLGEQHPAGQHIYCTCLSGEPGGYPTFFQHVFNRIRDSVSVIGNDVVTE